MTELLHTFIKKPQNIHFLLALWFYDFIDKKNIKGHIEIRAQTRGKMACVLE